MVISIIKFTAAAEERRNEERKEHGVEESERLTEYSISNVSPYFLFSFFHLRNSTTQLTSMMILSLSLPLLK